MSDILAGHAFIERCGWEQHDGIERFTATLVFPNGPPDIPFDVVWNRETVRIVVSNPND